MTVDYDVIVVGAGVAGALCAYQLAKQGIKVLMLESGPEYKSIAPLLQRYYATPIKTPDAPYPYHPQAPRPKVLNVNEYYTQKGDHSFESTYERAVGGTTWHWLGTSIRFIPEDFKLKTLYGQGSDWPIGYDQLSDWYDLAEKEMGVAGDDRFDMGAPRNVGYPLPPIRQSYLDQQIAAAVDGKSFLDSEIEVSPTPQARDPRICQGSTSCIPLCPTGAKYVATKHVNLAVKHGAKLISEAVVTKLKVNHDQLVDQVEYMHWDGSKHQVSGRYVVVAAHAIETPKLLLNSKADNVPNGIANHSDNVGRYLMDHPVALGWAMAKNPVFPYRGPMSSSGIENFKTGERRKAYGAFRIQISNDAWSWPTGAPTTLVNDLIQSGLYGDELQRALSKQAQRHVQLAAAVEPLPLPENRVTLSVKKRDVLGIPLPDIQYTLSDYSLRALEKSRQAIRFVFNSLGVAESYFLDKIPGAGHIIGTCRMGSDQRYSVVDAQSRAHDHRNLFIVGSSVFTTAGTANPTLTIAALSLRAADTILSEISHA